MSSIPTIVFLDLDNTFWTDDGVPDSARLAVHRAQEKGHLVFSNTGRARAGTRDLTPYGLDGRCFAAGSEAYLGDERIVDVPLGVEASRRLLELVDVRRGILIAEGGERCFVRSYDERQLETVRAQCAKTNDPFIDWPDISEMDERDHAQVYKYSLWVVGGVPCEVLENVPAGYRYTTMGDATEFTQEGLTKATVTDTVRAIVEERTGTVWRTMAFGDSGNDIPMLLAADTGVAMGNGTDAAKEAADYVCGPVTEDGLLRAFEHFGLA